MAKYQSAPAVHVVVKCKWRDGKEGNWRSRGGARSKGEGGADGLVIG
ncbi:hypothetical protein COLO4_22072 [Corchorus olitorius]|uniref:Uncharacterized protein n=1 Tax=Corchorus olitorius TaxID=93759 RepID=A0A1R3IP94_9ROSI|nr:hypothetical protein COLO4_22072 [Corchorus olitorius]